MKTMLSVALCCALVACSPPADSPPADAAAAAPPASNAIHTAVELTPGQQNGRAIYETMCWTCHGTAGRGDGPAVQASATLKPPTFQTQDYATSTGEGLRRRFTAELDQADPTHPHMQYVASLLKPENFADALSFIPVLGYPPEIPGSAVAGERIFQFRCVGCHGPTGRGNGTAASALVTMPPADFTTDTLIGSKNWDGLYARVRDGGRAVHGSSMPPWGTVMTDAEMWDLVAYLATFQPGKLSRPVWLN